MAAESLSREVLQGLRTGVAVVDPGTWRVLDENGTFFTWFGPDPAADDATADLLGLRLPDVDLTTAAERLAKGRPFRHEVQVGGGARSVTVELECRRVAVDGRDLVVVEGHDVTKRKAAEYVLDSYSRMAERNARDVLREKERAEKLLLNVMPRAVVEEMRDFGSVTPQRFDSATVLMLDFVGFTDMAVSREPGPLVSELNDIFSAFDRIVELFGCERMKTMGDAYLAVAGLPEQVDDHAKAVARVALRMRRYLEKRNASNRIQWLCRIGVHTGAVVGSIVGVQKYVYDIFGPGVNLAARLEAFADPMTIVMSADAAAAVGPEFFTTPLGDHDVKGFGRLRLHRLDGEVDHFRRP